MIKGKQLFNLNINLRALISFKQFILFFIFIIKIIYLQLFTIGIMMSSKITVAIEIYIFEHVAGLKVYQ